MRGVEVKLHPAYFNLGHPVCNLTSPPQLQLHDELGLSRVPGVRRPYFKVKLKLWSKIQVGFGILQLSALRMQLDFPAATSTSW